MGLGSRIKIILAHQHMTIAELAEKTGISKNTLYAMTKRDSNDIKLDSLQKIADALDVTLDSLLTNNNYISRPGPLNMMTGSYVNIEDSVADIHFSTDDYTMEEIEEILQFAEFIKLRRNK